jgi:hypothetical protein
LPDQEVLVYLNDFEELKSEWNNEKGDYDATYNLPVK